MKDSVKKEIENLIKKYGLHYSIAEFIFDKKYSFNWNNACFRETFSEDFIDYFNEDVDWDLISAWHPMSEQLIEKYQDKVKWSAISANQKLGEFFIYKYKNKLDMEKIIERNLITEERLKEMEQEEREHSEKIRSRGYRFELMEI